MASAAEQLASSISLANFSKATELKKRLWFTLGALILFRLLSFVPVPGIDPVAMQTLYQTQSGGILDVFQPVPISKVMLVCSNCGRPTRIGHATLDTGRRVRVCRHCGEQLEVRS